MSALKTTFALSLCAVLSAQDGPPPKLDPPDLRSDLELLRTALTEAHPSHYRYTDKAAFDAAFAAARKTAEAAMTETEFFRVLAPLVALVKCGHTRLRPSPGAQRRTRREACFLPLLLRTDGERLIVRSGYDTRLETGTEVLSIDGAETKQLLARMARSMTGDGDAPGQRIKHLNGDFAFWYAQLVGKGPKFQLVVRDTKGTERKTELTAASGAELRRFARPRERAPQLSFALSDDGVAKMRIGSFGHAKDAEGRGFAAFLKHAFTRMSEKKARALIIDLRGNGGGRDTNGSLLLAYLVDEEFPYYARLGVAGTGFSFLEHTNVRQSRLDALAKLTKRDEQGRLVLVRRAHANLAAQKPRSPRFAGKVYVLIDGGSFSATAEFAAAARNLGRCVFVGEETGGGYDGNTSGSSLTLTLPGSGLRVVIPLVQYVMAVAPAKKPARGIVPDHEVVPSLEDRLSGKDPAMQRALELASKSR